MKYLTSEILTQFALLVNLSQEIDWTSNWFCFNEELFSLYFRTAMLCKCCQCDEQKLLKSLEIILQTKCSIVSTGSGLNSLLTGIFLQYHVSSILAFLNKHLLL